MLSISMASVERINEVLTTKATIVSPENGIKEVADGSINFEDVTLPIPMKMATRPMSCKGINLSIRSGKSLESWEEQDQGNRA